MQRNLTKPKVSEIQVDITAKLSVRRSPKQVADELHPENSTGSMEAQSLSMQ